MPRNQSAGQSCSSDSASRRRGVDAAAFRASEEVLVRELRVERARVAVDVAVVDVTGAPIPDVSVKIGGVSIENGSLPYDATQGDQPIDVAFPEESWIVLRPEKVNLEDASSIRVECRRCTCLVSVVAPSSAKGNSHALLVKAYDPTRGDGESVLVLDAATVDRLRNHETLENFVRTQGLLRKLELRVSAHGAAKLRERAGPPTGAPAAAQGLPRALLIDGLSSLFGKLGRGGAVHQNRADHHGRRQRQRHPGAGCLCHCLAAAVRGCCRPRGRHQPGQQRGRQRTCEDAR